MFQVRQVALGDIGRLGDRLARETAARTQRPQPLAERDQQRILDAGLEACGEFVDGRLIVQTVFSQG